MKTKKLKKLSLKELKEINGGGVMKDFGRWCHEVWCEIKEATSRGFAPTDRIRIYEKW